MNTLRLALYRLFLQLVARLHTLLVSPGSTSSYAGLQNTLAFISVSAHSNGDTKIEAQKHSMIFLNQSYEVITSGKDKVA